MKLHVGVSWFHELNRVGFEVSSEALIFKSWSSSFDVEGESEERKRRERRRTGGSCRCRRNNMPSGEGGYALRLWRQFFGYGEVGMVLERWLGSWK